MEVPLSIRVRRVCIGLIFVAGMLRNISAPFVLIVGGVAVGARIIRDSSVFMDLLLLWLFDEHPLECLEVERGQIGSGG